MNKNYGVDERDHGLDNGFMLSGYSAPNHYLIQYRCLVRQQEVAQTALGLGHG